MLSARWRALTQTDLTLWGDKIHPWNFLHALFSLTELGCGHIVCMVHTDIALSLVGGWQLALTVAMANPCWWTRYWQITRVGVAAALSPAVLCERAARRAAVYACFSCKVLHLHSSRLVSACICRRRRLKNFALISVSDWDFMRVTRGDQQWFGEQSHSPILHKEPNTVCLGSGPSLDRGAVMSIV